MTYEIGEADEKVDPVDRGFRREENQSGVDEEWQDGVDGVSPRHDDDDGQPHERRRPLSQRRVADASRDAAERDAEDQHDQVDVVVVHFYSSENDKIAIFRRLLTSVKSWESQQLCSGRWTSTFW